MSFDSMLLHTLTIKRNAVTLDVNGDPVLGDYSQPVSAPATFATVKGLIQPRSAREIALASQAGAAIGTHAAYLRPLAGLTTADWIEMGGERYDLVSISDAGGVNHHYELGLVRVD